MGFIDDEGLRQRAEPLVKSPVADLPAQVARTRGTLSERPSGCAC